MAQSICKECGNEFFVPAWDLRRGRGLYCSRECYHQSRKGKPSPDRRKRIIKKCGWCSREFETGGRAGSKDQRYCSNRCSGFARVRNPVTNILANVDAAYLAGIVDGEGSIIIAKKRQARNTWRLAVANTDIELLEWCKEKTGVGSVNEKKVYESHHKRSFSWQCYSSNAKDILEQLLPYMVIERKKESAMQCINELNAIKEC